LITVWWGVKFLPGGHSTFFGFLNTGVHIVMYTYYMLAAMGPAVQKYLWWKKYLTVFQMVQFIAVMIHAFQLLFSNPCGYSVAFVTFIGLHAVMFYFLFKDFYDQAYKKVCSQLELSLKFFHEIFFPSKQKKANEKRLADKLAAEQVSNNNTEGSKTPLYQEMGKLEDSYELRNRVFVGSKN
jgi:elongation of very long chain fatty acids protein 7